MTEYAEQPPARRIRFDPTRVRDERLYARAYSHSRWVRRMKFILPAVAIAAVAGFFLTMRVVTGTGEAVISNAGINVAQKSLEMKAPHISGFTGTKQSYELKALRALQERGIAVPGDVAVTGWDDISLSAVTFPSLTTVSPDLPALARRALELLIDRVGGYGGAGRHEIAPHTLVARESTR